MNIIRLPNGTALLLNGGNPRLKIPTSILMEFVTSSLRKAYEGLEFVACGEIEIDKKNREYVLSRLVRTFVTNESGIEVAYRCPIKDVVLHTHVNAPPVPSNTDIENMKKDNMFISIGNVIRPSNPVYYVIAGITLEKNRISYKFRGYIPIYKLGGIKLTRLNVRVSLSSNASSKLNRMTSINYGIVKGLHKDNEIYIDEVLLLEEFYKKPSEPSSQDIDSILGYFVTGVSDYLEELQDLNMLYFILGLKGLRNALVLKFHDGIAVYKVERIGENVSLGHHGIREIEVIVVDA